MQGAYELADLIQIVDETMPEDDPEQCTGEAAEKVAGYIYETFYRPSAAGHGIAGARRVGTADGPPIRAAVADLIGTFLGEGKWDDQRGLKAKYFANREFDGDKLAIERVDAQVAFAFGEGSPDAEKIAAGRVLGAVARAVLAEETGDYEFCVKTENGTRLWVNDMEHPLIDAWVVSGE